MAAVLGRFRRDFAFVTTISVQCVAKSVGFPPSKTLLFARNTPVGREGYLSR